MSLCVIIGAHAVSISAGFGIRATKRTVPCFHGEMHSSREKFYVEGESPFYTQEKRETRKGDEVGIGRGGVADEESHRIPMPCRKGAALTLKRHHTRGVECLKTAEARPSMAGVTSSNWMPLLAGDMRHVFGGQPVRASHDAA